MMSSKAVCVWAAVFAGALLTGVGCANRGAIDTTRTITVHDMRGNPLEGTRIHVQGDTVVTQVATDATGTAKVGGLLDKPVSLVVSHPGYQVLTLSSRAYANPVRVVLKEDH